MSGGAWEYVAAFNNTDTNGRFSSYGWSGLTTDTASDKYATKYLNTTSNYSGNNIICTYGKIGDATKEVNKGGAQNLSSTGYYTNWFSDYPDLCGAGGPFVIRGGYYLDGAGAGVFCSGDLDGGSYSISSFRAVLCP